MSLAAEQLGLAHGAQQRLAQVSLTVAPGELIAVLGANGAGKSTLLALLAGETLPGSGQVSLGGRPLHRQSPRLLARQRALLPQRLESAPGLRARDVIAVGLFPHDLDWNPALPALQRALALSDSLSLIDRDYDALSGGEQARVQLARVFVQVLAGKGERYLLLDEPAAALDLAHQETLLRACRTLAHQDGIGVIAVLHDLNLAARHADRIALFARGQLVADDTPALALTAARIADVFGQPVHVLAHPTRPDIPVFVPADPDR